MTFIQWNDRFLIGHKVVDFDHKSLVNITNELFLRVEKGCPVEEITQTIALLIEYVDRHFEREEQLFKDSGYPLVEQHLAMHQDIRKTVRDIATLYQTQPSSISTDEVLQFLKKWLINHIMKADVNYVQYLK